MNLSEGEEWFIQPQLSKEIAFRNLYKKVAKEIFQDVFLKIWERHEMLGTEKSFRTYLFQIAENREIAIFGEVKLDNDFMNHIIYLSTEAYRHTEQVVQFKKNNAILEKALKIFYRNVERSLSYARSKAKSMKRPSSYWESLLNLSMIIWSKHFVPFVSTSIYVISFFTRYLTICRIMQCNMLNSQL